MKRRLRELLGPSLLDVVPRDHRQSDAAFRRRRTVAVITLLVGTVMLAVSLRIEPGNALFYPATLSLAVIWAIGAFASGPLHLGRIGVDQLQRPILQPIVIGLALAAVFVVGALVVREIPFLRDQVTSVTDHAAEGSVTVLLFVTILNGIAEEIFFRGALYAAIARHQVAITALAYLFVTLATGNVMLAFAAALLGVVVGLQRRASGGVLAPVLTHLSWSVTMLLVLPLLVR